MDPKATIVGREAFRCTIVSLVPFELREPKPGLTPGEFTVPASVNGKISVLVCDEASFGIYLDGDRGTLRARTPAIEVARSIIEDFNSAQLATSDNAKPGLFVVPGALTVEQVEEHFAEHIEEAKQIQIRWFERLVNMGDDSWNKYHQHGAITDLMRHACKYLGLEDKKEWVNVSKMQVHEESNKCPACFVLTSSPEQAICSACGCILNQEAYDKLTFRDKPKSSFLGALGNLKTPAASAP